MLWVVPIVLTPGECARLMATIDAHGPTAAPVTTPRGMNDDFTGGDTAFIDLEQSVRPVTGSALLFFHTQLHEGCEVTQGVKYAVRSDVMYRARA